MKACNKIDYKTTKISKYKNLEMRTGLIIQTQNTLNETEKVKHYHILLKPKSTKLFVSRRKY